ncbi:MAG: WecB/TagA/CpsF family glycosyltransferase [Proteobacteria bacterium]|nr:WecB/TagA/CpsF family glycosyltransferase [Pseudomonadota bacterium]
MIDDGKRNILGIKVSVIDYAGAVAAIIAAARERRPLKVSALAVHGIMTGALDREHRWRLNGFDIVTPDGQPVRWALNLLHKTGLKDRVYGPNLTLRVCEQAAQQGLPVYLYGSRQVVLKKLQKRLTGMFPGLIIAGARPSLFRRSTDAEKHLIADEIRRSGAGIVLVGLGCPRQEVWVYEYADCLRMPVLAVGAAFDFHAGLLKEAPRAMQEKGLEWLYRLTQEPKRLWRRYILLNPTFLALLFAQFTRLRSFADPGVEPKTPRNFA